MMPDASGNFKGISVGKVWPGHRDYEPKEPQVWTKEPDPIAPWESPLWKEQQDEREQR